ncbi:MAG: hypothetical protein J6Y53_04815 [Alphaproteobacteria bacterium]|nr:hypothetical protein [Alphaproteobacteria bacterium]
MPNSIETPIAVNTEEVTIDDNIYIKETYEDGTYAYKDQEGNVTSVYYPSGYTKVTALEDGDVLSFYDGGKIKSVESCNTHSSYTVLHDNGEIYESNPQYDYKLINSQNYDENGNLEEATLSDGTEISYYENGYCEEIITDDEDIIKFNDNGQVTSIQSSGKHSSFSFDHANGEHWQTAPEDDYTEIEEQTWYDNGQTKSKDNFDDSYTAYYENGYIETYYSPDHDQIEFDENGNLTSIHASGKHSSYELQHANGETWKSDPQYDYTNTKQQKWQDGNLVSTSVDVSNEEVEKMVKERAHWLCEQYIEATDRRLAEIQSCNSTEKTQYVKDMFDRLGHGRIYDKYCIVGQLNCLQDVCDSSGNLNDSYHNTTNCANFIANMKKNGYADCFSKNPKKEDIHPGDMIFTPRDKDGNYHVVSVKEVYQDEKGETHVIVNSFNSDGTKEFKGNGNYTVFNTEKYMEKALYKELEEQNLWQQEQDNGQYIASNGDTRQMDAVKYAEMNTYLTRGMEPESDIQLADAVVEHDNTSQTVPEAPQQESQEDQIVTGPIDTKYYEDGTLAYEEYPDGSEKSYRKNGKLQYEKLPDGTEKTYYISGNLKYEKHPDGTEKSYDNTDDYSLQYEKLPDGTENTYSDGKLIATKSKDGDWNYQSTPKYASPSHTKIEYYPDGTTPKHVERPDGVIIDYYENGQYKHYEWPSGDKADYYEHNGILKHYEWAEEEKIVEKADFDEKGVVKYQEDSDGTKIYYYENGIPKHKELPDGTIIDYDEKGQIKEENQSNPPSIEKTEDQILASNQQTQDNTQTTTTITKEEENNMTEQQTNGNDNCHVEYYDNGNIKYEEWPDGSKNFYYESGALQRAERDDMIVDYYENGNYKRLDYKDDNVIEYYENGNIKTAEYPEGDYLEFNEKGEPTRILSSLTYPSYTITRGDNQTEWTSDPQYDYTQIAEQTFENGKVVKEIKSEERQLAQENAADFHEYIAPEHAQKDTSPKSKTYYENGNVKYEELEDGSKNFYYENGKLQRTESDERNVDYYENGSYKRVDYKNGNATDYYENGYVQKTTCVEGDVIEFDEQGRATHIKSSGRFISYEVNHANGEKWHSPALRNYTKIKEQTWENGKLKDITRFTKEERAANYNKYHNPDGQAIINDNTEAINDVADIAPQPQNSDIITRENQVDDANLKWYGNDQLAEETLDSGLSRKHSADGKLLTRTYPGTGKPSFSEHLLGKKAEAEVTYTFYPNGHLKSQTNADGTTTTFEENEKLPQATSIKLPNGATIHYDAEGKMTAEELSDGRKITYSDKGNVETYEWPDGSKATYYETGEAKSWQENNTETFYYPNGGVKQVNYNDGNQIKFDENGSPTYIKSSGKANKIIVKDANGNTFWESDQKYDYTKIQEQVFYDNGNIKYEKFTDGTEKAYTRDGTYHTEKLPDNTLRTYDEGKIEYEKLPDGTEKTSFHEGYKTYEKLPDGTENTYRNGELMSTKIPGGEWQYVGAKVEPSEDEKIEYYPSGAEKHIEFSDGRKYDFYENGMPKHKEWPDGQKEDFYENGSVKHVEWNDGAKGDFSENGIQECQIYPDGTKKYTHPNGLLKHQENPDGSKVDYYENGMLSKKTDKDGNETNYDKEGNQITEKSTHQKEENSDELADKTETKNNKKSHKSKSSNAEYHENGYIKTYNSPDGDVLEFDDRGNITHIQSSGKVSSYDIEHPNGEHWQSPAQYDYTKIEEQTYENGELKSHVDKQKEDDQKKAREEERKKRREERKARRLERLAKLKALIAERYAAENGDSPTGIFQRHRQNDNQERQSPVMQWFKNRQSQNN